MFIMLLSACSSTTVHIYGKYLTKKQKEGVISIVEQQGLTAEVNQLDFPDSVSHTSIVYSPMLADVESVEGLISSLSTSQWPIVSSGALFSGNHWFKKDTIGLFVVPDGVKPHSGKSMQEIADTYRGENCTSQLNLVLENNGRFRFNHENGEKVDQGFASGSWQIRSYPYIELKSDKDHWWFYFTISKSVNTDVVGAIDITTLTSANKYSVLENCQFQRGTRR